jgi:hypothetical protein
MQMAAPVQALYQFPLMPIASRKTILVRQSIGLQTRLANDVDNEFNPAPPLAGDVRICRSLLTDYPNAQARTPGPSYGYNCHGLTFASRRTQVSSSIEVQHILKEDGYDLVSIDDALPGDVVIYQSTDSGELEHSGVVVERKTNLMGPKVVSKWGASQEFVHYYTACPYMPADVKFYRMSK